MVLSVWTPGPVPWRDSTFSESVVMLMEGFFAMTDVLEPQRLFLPAALPASASLIPPSGLAGGVLLPAGQTANQ